MSTYTTEIRKQKLPTGLDEVALNLSMTRFDDESLSDFRRRILLEARDPSGPTQSDFIRSLNRKVGLFDTPAFTIDLIKDAAEEPLAADPFVEVTSTHLRAYYDYENDGLDFALNLTDRDDGWWLDAVQVAFAGSTYFDITILDADYTYKRSDHLRYGNTDKTTQIARLRERYVNDLGVRYVKGFYPQSVSTFLEEAASVAALAEDGEFYVDYTNGVVFSHTLQEGYVMLTYRQFPYTLWWQPVRATPFNDTDIDYLVKDTIVDDEGLVHAKLNSKGADLTNQILSAHPMGWGE